MPDDQPDEHHKIGHKRCEELACGTPADDHYKKEVSRDQNDSRYDRDPEKASWIAGHPVFSLFELEYACQRDGEDYERQIREDRKLQVGIEETKIGIEQRQAHD